MIRGRKAEVVVMTDDEVTREAPADGPLPTTELDPAETAGVAPLAYSEHTSSMPVLEYRAPRLRPVWIGVLVLAVAAAVAGGAFVLGRTTGPQESVAPPVQASAPAQPPAAPPVAAPAPAPVAPAPPPVAVPAPPPTAVIPPAPTTTVPPLATPQARIAEPMICSLHNQYPQMQPVDLALTLVDRGLYNTYDEASEVVGLVLNDGCHGI